MSEYLVLLLVQITIFSSVTALLLLAVKAVFRKRIPPEVSLMLWLILFLRVMLPALPESYLSIYNLIPAGREIQYTLTHDYESGDNTAMAETDETEDNPYQFHPRQENGVDAGSTASGKSAAQDNTGLTELHFARDALYHRLCSVILVIFCGGMLLTGIIQIMAGIRAVRKVRRDCTSCTDPRILQIYTETAASLRIMDRKAPPLCLGKTTMLAGYCRPCVILCAENADASEMPLAAAELRMIFLHELNHYKHRDNWILLMSTMVCTFFWFNPLLWLTRNMLREDIEVLCDARTLEASGIEDKAYARMLCRSSHLSELVPEAGTAMSASGRNLKLRLSHISSRRKGMFLPRMVSFVLCACMIALCLTNPMVSAQSVYRPYIERVSAMTGDSERSITLSEQVTVQEFLHWLTGMLAENGDATLCMKIGWGELNSLAEIAGASPYVSAETADAVWNMTPDACVTLENCALLLTCLAGILSEGRFVEETAQLPEMISVNSMEALCRNLTDEESEKLLACYNIGVKGAQAAFSYVYTEAMMELILSRIHDDWSRTKLGVYYQKVSLSAEDLDKINAYLGTTVRYVGLGRDFYICDPELSGYEETQIRSILGAAFAGEREDVYYLKQTEDNCSFADAAVLFSKAGMPPAGIYDEYAQLGETTYTYTDPADFIWNDGSVWIAASQLDAFAARLGDGEPVRGLREVLRYSDTITYPGTDGADTTVSFRYYETEPENAMEGRRMLESVLGTLNAAAFTLQYDNGSVNITDVLSPGAEEACLMAADLGFIYFGSRPVSAQIQLNGGQCARILCRFFASMTNVN